MSGAGGGGYVFKFNFFLHTPPQFAIRGIFFFHSWIQIIRINAANPENLRLRLFAPKQSLENKMVGGGVARQLKISRSS